MTWKIIQGNAAEMHQEIGPESVHCVVTSPPYLSLRNYQTDGCYWPEMEYHLTPLLPPLQVPAWNGELGSEATPEAFVGHLVLVMRQVWRVLRNDGTVWLNIGDSYAGSGQGWSKKNNDGRKWIEDYGTNRPPGYISSRGTNGVKPKDLFLVPELLALALRSEGWYVRSRVIWCLSGGNKVYAKTPYGVTPIMVKDLVRLDPATVSLWNGQRWTQVLNWYQSSPSVIGEQRHKESRMRRSAKQRGKDVALTGDLEIVRRSGEHIGCTPGHVWPTERGNIRADELQIGDVIQTCRLPEPDNMVMPSGLDDDLVGWFVGLYIAEGLHTNEERSTRISSHSEEYERFKRLGDVASAFHGTLKIYQESGYRADAILNGPIICGIIDTYVNGRTAKDKHLNIKCWQRSNSFLLAVLQGYLDGDGHYEAKNNRYRIGFTNNDYLAADLRTICARLGMSIRLRRCKHKLKGKAFPGYRGQIRMVVSDHFNNRQDGEVIAIQASRARCFWDIEVEDDPHLFALASGVLTHNSKPDSQPESVVDRLTRCYEHVWLLSKQKDYFFDYVAIREPGIEHPGKAGTFSRQSGKNTMLEIPGQKNCSHRSDRDDRVPLGRNKRDVWTIPTNSPSWAFCTSCQTLYRGREMNLIEIIKKGDTIIRRCPQCKSTGGWVAHYAPFSPALAAICISAGSSPRTCEKCGAPWERITEERCIERYELPQDDPRYRPARYVGKYDAIKQGGGTGMRYHEVKTVGWGQTCNCENDGSGRSVVLDPFSGSGTTPMVAEQMGRDSVAIDASPVYCDVIEARMRGLQQGTLSKGGEGEILRQATLF
jgi:DNA modification methylase